MTSADVLVVGSGIAGLTFALKAAAKGEVLLVTKKERADSNTNYARGGIAAVLAPDDDPALHVRDTLVAGAGLCHRDRVEILVREGPERVRELVEWGAAFAREGGALSLGREGGHSRRRIVHAGDRTGRAIESALLAAVAGEPRIRVLEDHLVLDLRTASSDGPGGRRCTGARVFVHGTGEIAEIDAGAVFLATGGLGQVYRHTTNPGIATGDGVAMAHRAGARVANLEFVQFHPTALYPTDDPAFLISEAIRGEGAVLRRLDGTEFMEHHDPRGSLAPRDVVARAIDHELKEREEPHVLLDVSPIPRAEMERRFPGAVEGCRARGIDLFGSGIPVVPAAHYACGGVAADMDGRTSLPGLWAAGEVACTGVHGANRLASNSLLEAVVLSHRAAERLAGGGEGDWPTAAPIEDGPAADPPTPDAPAGHAPALPEGSSQEPFPEPSTAGLRAELRATMWERVGIVRSDARLAEAARRLRELARRAGTVLSQAAVDEPSTELANLLHVARLVVGSARWRRESRGLHHSSDRPWKDNEAFLRDTLLPPPGRLP